MSDNRNMELWESVFKTDPSHTKPITGKQYSGTSPKPYYLIQKATERFGPCGIGWGFDIEERIESGHTTEKGFPEKLHIAKVTLWYKWNGETGRVSHMGATPFSGQRSGGKGYTDEDAPKKSVTDALVKCLSMIGFAGDIFMGRYDDSKYVATAREEYEAEKAAKEAEQDKGAAEQAAKTLEGCMVLMRAAADHGVDALAKAWKALTERQRSLIQKSKKAATEMSSLKARSKSIKVNGQQTAAATAPHGDAYEGE